MRQFSCLERAASPLLTLWRQPLCCLPRVKRKTLFAHLSRALFETPLARVPEPLFFLGHVFRNGEITSKHLPELR